MIFRILLVLALVAGTGAVTKAVCQAFCSSVNGAASYDYCSPWISFSQQTNKTCYKLCVNNCYNVYDGSCMTNANFKCCLNTKPAKKQEFVISGCNILYNNVIDDYWN
ncbi:unnamed protein product [Caenorhabditis angaria]|uniref:Nematode Specific Peptide family, group C n=1 Tax=Caenorhabditis angaria TaxID=860376 RepID=A0A9P1IV72_9PELO|nr:unnamed protein product [Caenorhabditis angaria]